MLLATEALIREIIQRNIFYAGHVVRVSAGDLPLKITEGRIEGNIEGKEQEEDKE